MSTGQSSVSNRKLGVWFCSLESKARLKMKILESASMKVDAFALETGI